MCIRGLSGYREGRRETGDERRDLSPAGGGGAKRPGVDKRET